MALNWDDNEFFGKDAPASRWDDAEFFGGTASAEQSRADTEDATIIDRAKDTAIDLGKGVVSLGESVVGLGDIATFGALGAGLEKMGYDPQRTQEFLSGLQSAERQQESREVEEADGFVETAKALAVNPSEIIGFVVQSIPGTVGAGAAGGMVAKKIAAVAMTEAKALGLVGDRARDFIGQRVREQAGKILTGASAAEGAQAAGSIAEAGRQSGEDWSTYAPAAAASGALTAVIGKAGNKIGAKLGIGDIETDIAGRTAGVSGVGSGKGGMIGRVMREAVKEGALEEMPQSAQEQAFQNIATGRPAGEGVADAAAIGAFTGGAMGGGHALLSRQPEDAPNTDDETRTDAVNVNRIMASGSVDDALAAATAAAESKPLDPYAQTLAEQNAARQAQIDAAGIVDKPTYGVSPRLRAETPQAGSAPIPAGRGVAGRPAAPAPAQTLPESPAAPSGALPNLPPDPMVVFKDGTVARKGEVEAEIARLETAGQTEDAANLRARLIGYSGGQPSSTTETQIDQAAPAESIAYHDPRLKREAFRAAALDLVRRDMTPGGGISIVPDLNYKTGESDKRGEVPKIRTSSVHQPWIQSLLADNSISVEKVRAAVEKAVTGQPLGKRQQRVVTAILDQITGERTEADNLEAARAGRDQARTLRVRARLEASPDFDPFADPLGDAGEVWEELAYDDEMTDVGRVLRDLRLEAKALGLSDQTNDLMESQRSDEDIAAELAGLIAGAKNGRASETGIEAGTPGQAEGLRPEEAGETRVTAEEKRQLTADRRQKKRPFPKSQERRQGDRRQDPETRLRVDDMSPDEMRRALLVDEMTGLGNRRAYDESEKLPFQVSIDLDGLKFINDTYGHPAGDKLLAEFGAEVLGATDDGYHISGDEFIIQAVNESSALRIIKEVEARAAEAEIEVRTPAGETVTLTGIGFSYGIGQDIDTADAKLRDHKAERERQGFRGKRGESAPDRAVEATPERQPDNPDRPQEEVAESPAEAGLSDSEGYEFSSSQVALSKADALKVRAAASKLIDKADIDPTDGLEKRPHITVKYGLHTADAADLAPVLAGEGPITATVEGIEIFENDTQDVVVLRVSSPDLVRLNQKISDSLKVTDTHPDYKPHITLGYVKKGSGRKYANAKTGLEGKTLTFGAVEFSGKDGNVTPIALEKSTITPSVKKETDLLGEVPVNEQAIADAKREKDAKRNGRRDVPMDAAPGTLFNQGQQDIEDAKPEPAPAPQEEESIEVRRARMDLAAAMADLGSILLDRNSLKVVPEIDEAKLIPVLARVMDAAFRLGYHKFKAAARFALNLIREQFGADAANAVTLDHLQGAYIGMAGKYKEQGADTKKAVVSVESLDELEITDGTDQRSDADLERDRTDAEAQDGLGEDGVRADAGENGGPGEQGVQGAARSGRRPRGRREPAGSEAAAPGERGDFSPYAEEPATDPGASGDLFGERSDVVGLEGAPVEPDAADAIEEAAERPEQLASKSAAQLKAQSAPIVLADAASIDASLPFLHDGQRSDVLFAERRFQKPDGYGVLFTNGTGTGKTATGFGIAKRFERQGKRNILIVVPSDKIAQDWVTFGKHLMLDIQPLADTKSNGGKGIVVATYANFGQNKTLADRSWDLTIADESHYLMQSKDGGDTNALDALRAVTLHPRGTYDRASMIHRDLVEQIDSAKAKVDEERAAVKKTSYTTSPALEAAQKKLEALYREFDEKRNAIRSEVDASQGEKRPRVVFLSATPFAYEKTVDYAEGYLFDYQPDGRIGNQGGFEKFMVENFGYRIRYHKLTEPGPEVNRGLMQRQFNSRLKKEGVLSGRMLDVDHDYDRRFILVDSAIGSQIDAALQWMWDKRNEFSKAQQGTDYSIKNPYSTISSNVMERFDHLARRYLLEAIKAKEVIPHVRAQLDAGRKVVIFHDFKKGGGFNPFAFTKVSETGETDTDVANAKRLNAAIDAFNAQFSGLVHSDMWRANSPIIALTKAFPDILIFNGSESKANRRRAVELFQDDTSGRNLILVQSAAGKEGISLHDTTGKHQRVLYNLGLPTQPTTAIQQEGRIFRVGQASNAMFRYLNTGTNWERFAFATTIAQRSSTAENLALGEQARALLDGFIQAYEEADAYPVGHDGEGTGGKARDAAANAALTDWDRAMTMYFAQVKKTSATKAQEGVDYFATPEPLGLKMVEWADIRPGDAILEPSAGHGAIARWFPDVNARTVIEPSAELGSRLKMVTDAKLLQERFEDLHTGANKFDAIVMNPPFGTAGRTAVDHLAKAAQHLRDGGRIVALIPTGPAADKKFDAWFYGEQQRKAKPLGATQRVGEYYAGDIVTLDGRDGQYRIEGVGQLGLEFAPLNGGMNEGWRSHYIASVKPGPRTETYSPTSDLHLAADIRLPAVTFERAGTRVMARVVVLEKQTDRDLAAGIQGEYRDYTGAETIKEFFERIELSSINRRVKPQATEPGAAAVSAQDTGAQPAGESQAGFKLAETTHAKKGIKLFVATLERRVERDEYTRLNALAKKHGGYYSAFKGNGAIPGFQFESAESRAAFVAESAPDAPAYSRKADGYESAVDDVLDEEIDHQEAIEVGGTPDVLLAVNAPNLPLYMTGSVIDKVHYDHGLTRNQIKRIPDLIADPVAIFESDTQPGTFVVVTDEMVRGKPLVVAIHPNKRLGRATVNFIPSAHPRQHPQKMVQWVKDGLLRYINKQKSPGWQTTVGVRFPEVGPAARGSNTKIVTERDVVKKSGDSALSRKPIQRVAKSTVTALESTLRKPLANLRKTSPVNVVQSVADLPGNHPADVRGMFANGAVWLVADNLPANEAAAALAHELNHLGVDIITGGNLDYYSKIIRDAIRSGDKVFVDARNNVYRAYGELTEKAETSEIIALLAETNSNYLFIRRIINRVKLWLSKFGLANLAAAEINKLIIDAARITTSATRNKITKPVKIGSYASIGEADGRRNLAIAFSRFKKPNDFLFAVNKLLSSRSAYDAPAKEGVVDGADKNAQSIGDLAKTPAFRKKGFSGLNVPLQRAMLSSVVGAAQNSQVRKIIVQLVPVDVMDMLIGSERTTDMLLDNYSVFRDVFSAARVPSVPALHPAITSLVDAITLGGTKNLFTESDLMGLPTDRLPAVIAGEHLSGAGLADLLASGRAIDELTASDLTISSADRRSAGGTINNRHGATPSSGAVSGGEGVDASSPPPIISNDSGLYQRTQGGDTFVQEVLAELADVDELFRYPVSRAQSLEGVMADVFPGTRYVGDETRTDEREESGADRRFEFISQRGKPFYVFERGGDEVWIDVSRMEEGELGSGVYAAVANYAYNTGKVFIGDPSGLSEAAIVRRTSNMLSSVLRFGTTRHVEAAPEQIRGVPEKGIAPLEWRGSDVDKVGALIHTFLANLHSQFPQIRNYRYDFGARQFIDKLGRPVERGRFERGADRGVGRAGRAGQATMRRGIFLQSLVSSPRSQRPGILEQVLNGSHSLVTQGNLEAMFSRKANPEAASPSDIEATLFDELRFKAQDKFHYLSKVQKKAMADRGIQALPEAEDAYLAELRYHGMAGAAIEDFQREHVEPMLEVISKSGFSIEDVDLYLQARHAEEANAQLERINPDREDNQALSGMSNEEAAEILARLDSQAMRDIGSRVDAITKARREMLVESGLETQETVDAWESAYQHYVPLKRDGFDGRLPSKGMGFNTRGKEKRRAGSNRDVVHVLANVVAQYEATAIKAEKVKVGKAFLEFAHNNANPDLYEVDKVEYKPTFDAEGLVTYREDRGFIMADNVLVVRVDGVDHRITFNNQSPVAMRIAHAMNNLGATESGPIVNALSKLTRWLAIVNTGANPEFVISNFARDLQTAGYNLSATAADKLKWKIIKDVGKSWRGIRSFQKQDGKHHEWAQYFDEFRKAGAQTGWLQSYSSIEDREQALIQKIRDMGQDTTGLKVKAGLKAVIEFIENENTAVENAIRLSAFVHARRAGMTEAQAAKIAKEMTVNFNRKGDMGQVLNALYLFYNASIQGSVRLLQAVAKSRKVQIMAGATVVFAAVLDMINRSLGGDDDDGEAKYDKIPDFVKERNLIVMLPSGGGDYIKIPLPWGYNVLHVMGQGVGEALTQRDFQPGKSAMRVAASAVSAFNPIGGSESLLQFLSPTITDPLVQWAENKDWAGKPLRPASNPFGVDTPNSQKYWNSVRAPSKWLTDTMNELTGGDEVRPGAIDISPEAVDLLIDTFTGGAGRFVSDTFATPMKALTGEELETYEVPVLRKVYGAPGMGTVVSDFYERMESVQITDKQLKHYKGDGAKIAEIRRQHPGEVRLLMDMKLAQSQLRKVRKQIKLYEKSGNESALKIAREREKEIMRRFNKAYNNKMGRFAEAS